MSTHPPVLRVRSAMGEPSDPAIVLASDNEPGDYALVAYDGPSHPIRTSTPLVEGEYVRVRLTSSDDAAVGMASGGDGPQALMFQFDSLARRSGREVNARTLSAAHAPDLSDELIALDGDATRSTDFSIAYGFYRVTLDLHVLSGVVKARVVLPSGASLWNTLQGVTGPNPITLETVLRNYSPTQSAYLEVVPFGAGPAEFTVARASIRRLDWAGLFSHATLAPPDAAATVSGTTRPGFPYGVALALDNPLDPRNFIIAYHDGLNLRIDKSIAGVLTSLAAKPTPYMPGATVGGARLGSAYHRIYNGQPIGHAIALDDPELASQRSIAVFSTDPTVPLTNFTIWQLIRGLPAKGLTT